MINTIISTILSRNTVPISIVPKTYDELNIMSNDIIRATTTNYEGHDIILVNKRMRVRAKKLARFLSGQAPMVNGHLSHYWSMFTDSQIHSSRIDTTNRPGDILIYSGIVSQLLPLYESSAMRMMYVYEQADTFVHVYHTTQRSLMDGMYVFGATFGDTDATIPYIGGQHQRSGTVRFHQYKMARMNDNMNMAIRTFFDRDSIDQSNRAACSRFQKLCRSYVETGEFDPRISTTLRPDIHHWVNKTKL